MSPMEGMISVSGFGADNLYICLKGRDTVLGGYPSAFHMKRLWFGGSRIKKKFTEADPAVVRGEILAEFCLIDCRGSGAKIKSLG